MATRLEMQYNYRLKSIKSDCLRDDIPEFIVVDGELKKNWVVCPNCGTRVLVNDLPYFKLCPKCLTNWDELRNTQGLEYKDKNERVNWSEDWHKYMFYDEIEMLIKDSIEDSLNMELPMVHIVINYEIERNKIWNKYYVDIGDEYEKCLADIESYIHKLFGRKKEIDMNDISSINKFISSSFVPVIDKVKSEVERKATRNTVIFYLEEIEGDMKTNIEKIYSRVKRFEKLSLEELLMQDEILKGLDLTKDEMKKYAEWFLESHKRLKTL